eukprot:gene258-6673_t
MSYLKQHFKIDHVPGTTPAPETCINPYPDYDKVHTTILQEAKKNPKIFEQEKEQVYKQICSRFMSKKRDKNCQSLVDLYYNEYSKGIEAKLEIHEIVGAKIKHSYERIQKQKQKEQEED